MLSVGVAVDEKDVGAGGNDAGRLVDDGDGDAAALLLCLPILSSHPDWVAASGCFVACP